MICGNYGGDCFGFGVSVFGIGGIFDVVVYINFVIRSMYSCVDFEI